jgi:hypothetical protein
MRLSGNIADTFATTAGAMPCMAQEKPSAYILNRSRLDVGLD